VERPGNSKRLVGYLLRVVCGLGLFVGHGGMVLGLQPEDGLPARVVDGERFESLQFAAEEIPAPVEAETDTETILAPDPRAISTLVQASRLMVGVMRQIPSSTRIR